MRTGHTPNALFEKWRQDQIQRQEQQSALRRSATQKLPGLEHAEPQTSTESYDLSIIDELDVPGL